MMTLELNLLIATLLDNPTTALLGCITIVPVTIWIVSSISWMIMGDMDPLVGIPSLLVSLFLGFVAMDPPSPEFSPLALASAVGMLIVYPFIKRQMDRRDTVRLEVDQIDKAYKMIQEKPTHAFLKYKLAEALYLRGLIGPAHAIAQAALQDMPKGIFPDEHRSVQRWALAPGHQYTSPCLKCGTTNNPENIFCSSCGSAYLADYARGKWLGSGLVIRLVAAWVMAVVSLVGVPYVRASTFAPPLSGTLIVVQLAICGWLLWMVFLKKEKKTT